MVLVADPHRGADEAVARVTLVHHRIPVAIVLPNHLTVHYLLRGPTVARYRERERERETERDKAIFKKKEREERRMKTCSASVLSRSTTQHTMYRDRINRPADNNAKYALYRTYAM